MQDNKVGTWLEEYYSQLKPEIRQELLQSHRDEQTEAEFTFRSTLFTARYGRRRLKNDAFVGYVMDMKYISESDSTDIGGRKKKLALETVNGLYLFDYDTRPGWQQDIIYSELRNVWLRYMDISANGRGFTSVLFGMGQLSDEGVARKIAEQISAVAYKAPHMLHMDREFAVLQRAAVDAFRQIYPNREHFLKKC